MRMHLAGWACVLAAGVALAGDKPKKDKPTTTPLTADVGRGGLGNLGVKAALADTTFTISKPVGTWVRDVQLKGNAVRVRLAVTDDRLTLKAEFAGGRHGCIVTNSGELQVTADYAINKESCLFGVIDTLSTDQPLSGDADKLLKLSGQPFSIRFRADQNTVTLKDFRGFGVGVGVESSEGVTELLLAVSGQYTKVDPSKPLPPLKAVEDNSGPLIRQDELLNQHDRPAPATPGLTPLRIHGGILKADPPKEGTRLGGVPYPTPHYLKHYPTYIPPDPPFPLQRERDKPLDPTGELKQAKSEEPAAEPTRVLPPLAAGECGECDPPTDAAVLKAVGAKAKEFDGTITIIKNNVKDQLEPARLFSSVGMARLHHCQWECRVYFSRDLRTEKPEVEVVYLDTDYLRLASAGQIVVPER
jgi:hypothetical protein